MHCKSLLTVTLILVILSFPGATCFPSEKPVVYFGVNLRFDPIVMYERYQPMMDYLTRSTPYRFELKLSRNYREGVRQLDDGETQIASLGDGGVMAAILDGAVPVVKPLNEKGKPFFRSVIVVADRSGIRTERDLAGRRVALGYRHSLTGNLIARQMLIACGLDKGKLAALDNLRKHSQVARSVLKGEYDAGFLKDVVAKMYANRGLRVLASSADFPSTPLVARRGTPPEVIRAFTAALVKLDRRNPEHAKLMNLWDEEYKYGFVPVQSGDYRDMMRLYRSMPYGCGNRCHR